MLQYINKICLIVVNVFISDGYTAKIELPITIRVSSSAPFTTPSTQHKPPDFIKYLYFT